MANKYWENEKAIVTETKYAEVRYYKEAGKIQLYGTYQNKDGEFKRTKAAVWDNNDMDADDALKLAYAVMQGLLDVGIENEAFAEAYEVLHGAAGEDDSDDIAEETDEVLDEEFEDEEPVNYESMTVAELKIECQAREIELPKRAAKAKLIQLLQSDDEGTTSTGKTTSDAFKKVLNGKTYTSYKAVDEDDEPEETVNATEFIGKNIICSNGEFKKASKRVKKVYMEYMDDCNEWVTYILEQASEIRSMPTKTKVQKNKQNKVYDQLKEEVSDWVNSWEDVVAEEDDISLIDDIAKQLMLDESSNKDEAMVALAEIVDRMVS